jgi:hypothetical protein
MKRQTLVQLALGFLLFSALFTGIAAAAAPHAFYDDFPFLRHWVDLLPPYNEHLVTDVGELYLGFAVLFGWALWTLQPTLVRAVCTAWLVPSVLHLIFHATHLGNFDPGDAIAEIASLTLVVLPAALVLWALRDGSEGEQNPC